jgi:hypothetical protein
VTLVAIDLEGLSKTFGPLTFTVQSAAARGAFPGFVLDDVRVGLEANDVNAGSTRDWGQNARQLNRAKKLGKG